jgi:hypothetical protein
MPAHLKHVGFHGSQEEFGNLDGVAQLDYIKTLLKGQIKYNGKPFDNPVDYYISNMWGAALKLPDVAAKNPDAIILELDPKVNRYKGFSLASQTAGYLGNKGLDGNRRW